MPSRPVPPTSEPGPDATSLRSTVARLDLPLDDEAPAIARRTVQGVLDVWLPDNADFTYDVVLLTSELVSNAVRHGGERVSLELRRDAGGLLVCVVDGSSSLPQPRASDEFDESGRGLAIVRAIATSTGVDELRDGKRVWARIALPVSA